MNILIYIDFPLVLNTGGVQRSTLAMAEMFMKSDHFCVILQKSRNIETSSINGVELLNLHDISSIKSVSRYREILQDYAIDIVINQSGFDLNVTRFLAKHKPQEVRLISTLRMNPLNFVQNYTNIIESKYTGWKRVVLKNVIAEKLALTYHRIKQAYILNKLMELNDYFTVLNESFVNELNHFWINESLIRQKVRAIPNVFFPVELNDSPKENVILYVGRLEKNQKRVDLLGEIWNKLIPELPDWKFIIVGDGSNRVWLEEYFQEKALDNRIEFKGSIDPTPYYRSAKIFCFTSAYEGLGNVLIEAQQYGVVPVMFNSYSAANDLVLDEQTGFLVKPYDIEGFSLKVLELAKSEGMRTVFGEQAKRNAKRFEFTEISKHWAALCTKN